MSVIPGYGGQKFLKETTERISYLEKIREEQDLHFVISVDGGISEDTIKSLKENKLDRIVAGSYVCKSANFDKQIEKLENVVK